MAYLPRRCLEIMLKVSLKESVNGNSVFCFSVLKFRFFLNILALVKLHTLFFTFHLKVSP